MMKKVIFALFVFVLFGCDQSPKSNPEEVAAVKEADSRTGRVLETIDVESYTYIRLEQKGQEVWLAASPITVSKGELVRYSGEMMMQDFYSKALDRTFPAILFAANVELVEPGSATLQKELAETPDVTELHKNMSASSSVKSGPVSVEPLEGGMTIAEIFTKHEQIEGQQVSLRAQVTKFSPNILGKSWITLQDGTGTAPDASLVVTSADTVAVGDVVVARGLVRSNVDIGAGYVYKVLLEETGFSQENTNQP